MPIHDWTRVDHGAFHDFHQGWLATLRSALNDGRMPPDYYAMIEKHTPDGVPDVVTLQDRPPAGRPPDASGPRPSGSGVLTVEDAPPAVALTVEADVYTGLRRTIAVRDSEDARVVALIEVVSPGNKTSRHGVRSFVTKVTAAVGSGVHVLVIDLIPPGPRDPDGLHPLVWEDFADVAYRQPPDRPLTLASYSAGDVKRAYVQPAAVGEPLPDMPLFLTPDEYVNVPLEATYQAAFDGIARSTRQALSG